jgi:hypothetical protein
VKHLIIDLKTSLELRRKKEAELLQRFDTKSGKEIILVTAGKLIELDLLIEELNELITYDTLSQKNA